MVARERLVVCRVDAQHEYRSDHWDADGRREASNFTVRVTDAGSPAQTATQALSILVNAAPPSGLFGNTNNGSVSDNIWVAPDGSTQGSFKRRPI